MKKHALLLPAVFLLMLFLSSCVHRTPFREEYYFQAMGDPAELVVTMDFSKSDRLYADALRQSTQGESTLLGNLIPRIDRVSMAFYEPAGTIRENSAAVDLGSYSFYGGIEGNIPRFITNTALLWTPGWQKIENDRTRYYRNEAMNLDVAVPKNGILLFSQGDYMRAYDNTYANRVTKIPYDLAKRMAASLFGFYVTSPQAMLDIGLDIPLTVLKQMNTMLLMIEEKADGLMVLQGSITMNTTRLANSLSILMKTSYISDKRRTNTPLGDLTNLFILKESTLLINDMALSDEQLSSFTKMFGSLLSATGGKI